MERLQSGEIGIKSIGDSHGYNDNTNNDNDNGNDIDTNANDNNNPNDATQIKYSNSTTVPKVDLISLVSQRSPHMQCEFE